MVNIKNVQHNIARQVTKITFGCFTGLISGKIFTGNQGFPMNYGVFLEANPLIVGTRWIAWNMGWAARFFFFWFWTQVAFEKNGLKVTFHPRKEAET